MQNGPTRPEGKITLAQIYRGLAVAVGFGGSFLECSYDHFQHPIALAYLLGFFGLQAAASGPFWKQAALWLIRAERISIRVGPIGFDREVGRSTPLTATTIRVPLDELPPTVLPEELRTQRRSSTSHSPNPPDEHTPIFPFESPEP